MSIDAGGLAQMTYQSHFNNSIGVSGPGFASRGKGTHIKRLSVAPPPQISTIDETQQFNISSINTPRTSRGHLLAGLRTAPKSATVASTNSGFGLESSKYASPPYSSRTPQSTTASGFPSKQYMGVNAAQQMYSRPEHVLSPPTLNLDEEAGEQMDQGIYNELLATNAYLAQQQRALQQQLASVTAAAQQMAGLNLNTNMNNVQQLQPQLNSPMTFYNQQYQHGLQPIVQPVPNSPGLFAVYNPMTGQSSFFMDNSLPGQDVLSPPYTNEVQSPVQSPPAFQRQYSPQREAALSPTATRSGTPPKPTPSPAQDVEPLPPPSANAFRRGHKKGLSSVSGIKATAEWSRTSRTAGFPQTPMTGTFGPGQGRAGEHPTRQPRGPPLLQELQEKPTAKHEGSKNFATRQRRRAVHDLVRAGRERRSESRQPGSGSGTPGSESEFVFSVSPSDNEEVLAGSTSLSSKPSLGSIRAAASGAIGSERKEKSRERCSVDSTGSYGTRSLSSEEGNAVGGSLLEVEPTSRRNTPILVLSSAEKRKSLVM